MGFFAYLFNPWSNNKSQKKQTITRQPEKDQHAQEQKIAPAVLTEAYYEFAADDAKDVTEGVDDGGLGMTSFPPFIPTAPNPHGTREFLRAAIAERSGTPQQVVKASEDIKRVNEEALRQVKEHEGQGGRWQAASSLQAILSRHPPPKQSKGKNPRPESPCCALDPAAKGVSSPGKSKKGRSLEKRKKPSYSHLRIPRPPQKVLRRPDRHRRPSQKVDSRLSPLGPMAERLQAMAMEEYDSERDWTD